MIFESAVSALRDMWETNQFLNGGLVLMLLGALLAALRNVPRHLFKAARHRWLVTVEIRREHELQRWVAWWLGRHLEGGRRNLKASLRNSGREEPEVIYEPGNGHHLLRWRRRWFLIQRELSEGGKEMGVQEDIYRVMTIARTAAPVRELLETARSEGIAHAAQAHRVFYSMPGHWQSLQDRRGRPLGSVVLPESVAEGMLEDCRSFFDARAWYHERGLPWRRGYLLHGPPGGGKSSVVTAIATELDVPLYWLNLRQTSMSDGYLVELMSMMRSRSILLLEDLDCALLGRDEKAPDSDRASQVTMSGLLNAIDGVLAGEGRVLFITTNRLDKIDSALRRPGRTDVKLEIGYATPDQAERLFLRFFPGDVAGADAFAASLPPETSMARLQEVLLCSARTGPKAVRDLRCVASETGVDAVPMVPMMELWG